MFGERQMDEAESGRLAAEVGFRTSGYLMRYLRGFEEQPVQIKICLMELAGELEGLYSSELNFVTGKGPEIMKRIDKVLDLNQRLADANVPARFLEAADLTAKACAFASRTISTDKGVPFIL